MSMAEVLVPSPSQEAELDRRLETLIGKLVRKTASDKEAQEYQELSAARVRMMEPAALHALESIRADRRRRRVG